MTNAMTLEFDAADKQLLEHWGRQKTDRIHEAEKKWVNNVATFMKDETNSAFAMQKQPGGSAWHDNSPSWNNYKASHGGSSLINVFTGRLRDSISTSKTKNSSEVYTTVPYAESIADRNPFIPTKNHVSTWGKKMAEELLRHI